jgi:predicted glycoside hydrolase/deacetylase ChbG (UPF0249 family)
MSMRRPRFPAVVILSGVLASVASLVAQSQPAAPQSLAQRLGFPADSRLVMIHADDIGVTHGVNQAVEKAFTSGSISSASIIVPSAWFPQAAAFARDHPEFDFGLHLALTSEWRTIRWSGIAPSTRIPSLLDPDGYLWRSTRIADHVRNTDEVRIEMRAQIERARHFGVPFTHFDTHMDTLTSTPEMSQVYADLGREYGVPIWGNTAVRTVALGGSFQFQPEGHRGRALEHYRRLIAEAKPDEVTVLVVHLALESDELRSAMGDNRFGATWRIADFDIVTSAEWHAFLKQQRIQLVTWKHVKTLFGPK